MGDMTDMMGTAIKFYFLVACLWCLMIGGCAYGCQKYTGYGISVQILTPEKESK